MARHSVSEAPNRHRWEPGARAGGVSPELIAIGWEHHPQMIAVWESNMATEDQHV